MRALLDMDTIQIEITNACIRSCSNCTRFCGHFANPYFMDLEFFKKAVDSMVDYPKMTGVMGGEPLLHPQFHEMCEYLVTKIPYKQLGLWTGLPKGYEHHAKVICDTFKHIFINDHTQDNFFHCPILVAAEEIVDDKKKMFYIIDKCWIQNSWSAAINPKGAFFCEIAASMSLLFDGPKGWPVEAEWWARTPKDFTKQIEWYCPKCGCAFPLPRRRSTDGIDDISESNLKRLKDKSPKIKRGLYQLSNLTLVEKPEEMALYKDLYYRQRVANRFGIYLAINDQQFMTPVFTGRQATVLKPLFDELKEKYDAVDSECIQVSVG